MISNFCNIYLNKLWGKNTTFYEFKKWELGHLFVLKIIFCKNRFYSVMNRLGAILIFYKSVFIWSFLINVLLIMVTPYIFITILTKLFLVILILLFMNETKTKYSLLTFEKGNISQMKLFGIVFVLDTLMTTSTLSAIKVFI